MDLETDCAKTISLVHGREGYQGQAQNLVELCRNLLDREWEVKMSHIPREQNKVADALTKLRRYQNEDFMWFDEPPREIEKLLRVDELGLLGSSNTVRVNY